MLLPRPQSPQSRYVGLTDGEAPERGWSMLNPFAGSTAEMGPGMRRDTINDAFNDMNHKKIVGFGKWLLRKLEECVAELNAACADLEELGKLIRGMGGGAELKAWKAEVEAWEEDAKKPNPFASKTGHKTVVNVRREMAEEVRKEMDSDELEGLEISDEMHATKLIGMGPQLQRNLAADIAGTGNHPSPDQQLNLTERANKLRRKLLTWMDAEVAFIPHVALLRAEEDRARRRISATQTQPGMQVHAMVLWVPSDIQGHVPSFMNTSFDCEWPRRTSQWRICARTCCYARITTSTRTDSPAGSRQTRDARRKSRWRRGHGARATAIERHERRS
ncbi:hypothetical protein B0H13DRAFT_804885 [Mycena leptocephala]|nr:hypothetical protein B0H13DRAFT_804885 [Mycena leptocephala]